MSLFRRLRRARRLPALLVGAVLFASCASAGTPLSASSTSAASSTPADAAETPSPASAPAADTEDAIDDPRPVATASASLGDDQGDSAVVPEDRIVQLANEAYLLASTAGRLVMPTPPDDLRGYLQFWAEHPLQVDGQLLDAKGVLCVETLGTAHFRERSEDLSYPRAAVFPYLWERDSYVALSRQHDLPIADEFPDTRVWPPSVERESVGELELIDADSQRARLPLAPTAETWMVSWEVAAQTFVGNRVVFDPASGALSVHPRIRAIEDLFACVQDPAAADSLIPESVLQMVAG